MSEPKPLQHLLAQAPMQQAAPPCPSMGPDPSMDQGPSKEQGASSPAESSKALPGEWVERIFQIMAANYGARFADAWRGVDAETVKAVWAKKLGALKPEQIRRGIASLEQCKFPPTLPEFMALCKQAVPQAHVHKLAAPRLTPEQREQARSRLHELKRLLGAT